MKNTLPLPVFFLFAFISNVTFAQTFSVGHKSQTFIDPSRANRNITAEIYYPANTTGDNVTIAAGQFPVLVFGHGFVMTWSSYDVEWNAIVPHGYIMVFPTTETSFSPSHTDFGKDIAFLAGAMKSEGLNPASFFYGAIASKSAAMGHSMGGGCAFLAMQYDTAITVLATLAAANTSPSSITAARTITKPSIVFSGVNDCVTPPATHQIPMYDSLNSTCKTLINITGGAHCYFAGNNTNCYLGQATCTPKPAISASAQQSITFNLLIPWLNFYLKNSCASGSQFQGLITASSGITSQQNCILNCSATGLGNELYSAGIVIAPNPFNYETTISFSSEQKNTTITIIDMLGNKMKSVVIDGTQNFILDKGEMKSGIYFLKITDENKNVFNKKIVIR
jgi:hypothetical protein